MERCRPQHPLCHSKGTDAPPLPAPPGRAPGTKHRLFPFKMRPSRVVADAPPDFVQWLRNRRGVHLIVQELPEIIDFESESPQLYPLPLTFGRH